MPTSFINVRPPQNLLSRARPGDQIGYFGRGGLVNQITSGGAFSNHIMTASTPGQGMDDTGGFVQGSTSAIAGNDVYVTRSVRYVYRTGFITQFKFRISQTTNLRFYAGTSTTARGFLSADSDFFSIGLSYSTVNGDTNWQFLSQDNGAPVRIDSGVPADTDPHVIEIEYVPNSFIRYRLFNSNLTELQAEAIQTSTLPSFTALYDFTFGISTQNAVTKTIKYYYAEGLFRPTE